MKRIVTMSVLGWMWALAGWPQAPATYEQTCQSAQADYRKANYDGARNGFQRALELATNDLQRAQALLGLAQADRDTRQYDSAIGESRKALALPGLAQAKEGAECWRLIGDCRKAQRQYAEAAAAYQQVVSLDKVEPSVLANAWAKAGDAYYSLTEYAKAREAYAAAVKIPKVAPLHLLGAGGKIGDCYLAERQYAEARAAYEAAAMAPGVDPVDKAYALAGAGHAAYEAGDYPGALDAYVVALNTPYAQDRLRMVERLDSIYRLQGNRAEALLAAGQYAAARSEYEKLLAMTKVAPHDQGFALVGIGDCLAGEKRYPEARAAYEKVLGLKGAYWPDRGRAQAGIARCYEAEGNATAAKEAQAKAAAMKNTAAAGPGSAHPPVP